jgi:hypothetical protein
MQLNLKQLKILYDDNDNSTYHYDIVLPDETVVNINMDEEDIDNIICYENKGLPVLNTYEIIDIENLNDSLVTTKNYERGNLYLSFKK